MGFRFFKVDVKIYNKKKTDDELLGKVVLTEWSTGISNETWKPQMVRMPKRILIPERKYKILSEKPAHQKHKERMSDKGRGQSLQDSSINCVPRKSSSRECPW